MSHMSVTTTATVISGFTGVPLHEVRAAADNVATGRTPLLVLSGRMGSGKDSVAADLMGLIAPLGHRAHAYADPIRAEVGDLLATSALFGCHPVELPRILTRRHNVPADRSARLAGLLCAVLATGHLDPTERTAQMRALVQYVGADLRRADDPAVWVRRTLAAVVADLSGPHPTPVAITDARFPDEVAWPALLGATTVRLHVSPDTQADRLAARDRAAMSPAHLGHRTETALDDYDGFDLVVDTDGTTRADVVGAVLHHLGRQRPLAA